MRHNDTNETEKSLISNKYSVAPNTTNQNEKKETKKQQRRLFIYFSFVLFGFASCFECGWTISLVLRVLCSYMGFCCITSSPMASLQSSCLVHSMRRVVCLSILIYTRDKFQFVYFFLTILTVHRRIVYFSAKIIPKKWNTSRIECL